MNVTLHLAISIDGLIARTNGDSSWISPKDEELFLKRAQDAGCIIVGRKTFEQFEEAIYPISGITNIVLTREPSLTSLTQDGVEFATTPQEALSKAREKGHENVLIAGGGETSAAFLEERLLNEIFLTVHPMVLGEGIKVFSGLTGGADLELLGLKELGEGLIELHYKVC